MRGRGAKKPGYKRRHGRARFTALEEERALARARVEPTRLLNAMDERGKQGHERNRVRGERY